MAKRGLKGISDEELAKYEALLAEDPDIIQMDESGNIVDREPEAAAPPPPVEEPPVAEEEAAPARKAAAEEPRKEGTFSKGGPNYKGREWALSLEELHGDNPDDWKMIYDFSYDYILGNWQGIIRNKTERDDYFLKDDAEQGRQDVENFVGMAFARLVLKAPVFRTLQEARGWVAQAAATEWWNAIRKERGTTSTDKRVGEEGETIRDTVKLSSLTSGDYATPENAVLDAVTDVGSGAGAEQFIARIRENGDKRTNELLDQALALLEKHRQMYPESRITENLVQAVMMRIEEEQG